MMHTARLAATILSLAAAGAFAAVAGSPQEAKPLAVGAKAPGFVLKTADNADFDLGAAFAKKPTLLIFYRGGWCPFCNRHLAALGEIEAQLRELGWQIIALSPDRPAALKPTMEKDQLAFTLLSDRGMQAADAYGLAFNMDAATVARYRQHGIDLAPVPGGGDNDFWLPVPAAFLVGRDGLIKFAHANADYRTRLAPDDLLAAARSAKGG